MFLSPLPNATPEMTHETHADFALASPPVELSLQELHTVSGGNRLDNIGTLNVLVANKVLPIINIAQSLKPQPDPWKAKVLTPGL
jgi:hypothetical protein